MYPPSHLSRIELLGPEIELIRSAVDGSDVHVQGLVHFETPTS